MAFSSLLKYVSNTMDSCSRSLFFDICLLFSNALLSILLQFYCLPIAASHILLWQNMNYECLMKGDCNGESVSHIRLLVLCENITFFTKLEGTS